MRKIFLIIACVLFWAGPVKSEEVIHTDNATIIELSPEDLKNFSPSGSGFSIDIAPSEKETNNMEAKPLEEVKKETKNQTSTYVVLETDKGDIKIKLFLNEAPITAGNFLDLVKRKFYNGLTFHRIIPGFVIQGGCPKGDGTGNFIDPETQQPRYIKHESSLLEHNAPGIVAMARTSDPDSASCQFFIDLEAQPYLDAGGADPFGYAVFGKVVEGMNVVNKIVKENVAPFPGSDGTSNPVKILSTRVIEE